MEILRPLAWIGVGLVAFVVIYAVARLTTRAYFKSKIEYHKKVEENKNDKQ